MEMEFVKNQYGENVDFEVANNLMDEDICEDLNRDADACESNQAFYDAYCKAHKERFGEEFVTDQKNGQY